MILGRKVLTFLSLFQPQRLNPLDQMQQLVSQINASNPATPKNNCALHAGKQNVTKCNMIIQLRF